jgi:succinate dehydrogenase / fumarate reductase, cytochrome b subunit
MTMNGETSRRLGPGMRKDPRPKYLDLLRIRQPVPAILSILHRISGFGLFLAIPFLLYLFQLSITSPEDYVRYRAVFAHPLTKLLLIGLAWALFHHLFAGIRFLLMDVHVGLELQRTRANSIIVITAAILCTIGFGVLIW